MWSPATAVCAAVIVLFCRPTLNAQDGVPRFEFGAVLSTANQADYGNYFHVGGGGRVTINVTKYLAGEIEATGQPTYIGNPFSPEVHTVMAAKGTYRAEQRRWLRFAGINFLGVIGPAFVNRTVDVGGGCFFCGSVLRRQVASMLDWGGGFEVVPARRVAIRFDVTHANFSETAIYYSGDIHESRTYLKVAVMLRVP